MDVDSPSWETCRNTVPPMQGSRTKKAGDWGAGGEKLSSTGGGRNMGLPGS